MDSTVVTDTQADAGGVMEKKLQEAGVMGKVSGFKSNSESALELWRCALEKDEGAFELKSVHYDYGQPLSPNCSTEFSSGSASPRSAANTHSLVPEEISFEEKSAATEVALRLWQEAAAKVSPHVGVFQRGGKYFIAVIKSVLLGKPHPAPWWMRRSWREGARPRGLVSNISGLAEMPAVRVATSVGTMALACAALYRLGPTRK